MRHSADPTAGERFPPGTILAGRYTVIERAGHGGMGEVYKVEDLKLGQTVALKCLPDAVTDDAVLARLYREVSLARRVSHPNVCRVYDVGEMNGRPFLTMEFIRGEDLASVLKRFGRLPTDKAVEISRQLCAGLAAVHEQGLLHRDLKPANVMIDEDGHVRLMDFGVAGVAEDLKGHDARTGTPAYMSPEQLHGEELTTRSDIYSAGLVLYEILTGRKAFEGGPLLDVILLRRTQTPVNPSALVKDLDPLIERAILRCLEQDPGKRPASALHVAAALPGGDPLQAALAAGETPTPEMVAAAPTAGALRPAVAATLVGFVLLCLAAIIFLSGSVRLHENVPLDKPPAVLAERAREVITRLGYTAPPVDMAYGFYFRRSVLRYFKERDQSRLRWDRLRNGEPRVLFFWFRQSPRYLMQARGGRVFLYDPPWTVSGMAGAVLDSRGQLAYFEGVPWQIDVQQNQPTTPDWTLLFAEAGLDMTEFRPSEPRWTPPQYADMRVAWEGDLPGRLPIPVRIEAAAARGRPVYFQIVHPWDRPYRQDDVPLPGGGTNALLFLGLLPAILIGSLLLARRNVLAKRDDRRGAVRLAVFVFALWSLRSILWTHHVPNVDGIFQLVELLGRALFLSAFSAVVYLGLEPFVRARWPHRIVSWSRVLAGELRDPMVGRDVLIGTLAGLSLAALNSLWILAPGWFGWLPDAPVPSGEFGLGGSRWVLERTLICSLVGLLVALGCLFLLLLQVIILRREWLAAIGLWALIAFVYAAEGSYPLVDWVFAGGSAALIVGCIMRFGLLASVLLFFFLFLASVQLPITSNLTAWHSGGTFMLLGMAASTTVYGYYTSVAGQRLIGEALLPDRVYGR